jgi:hypothetical protein
MDQPQNEFAAVAGGEGSRDGEVLVSVDIGLKEGHFVFNFIPPHDPRLLVPDDPLANGRIRPIEPALQVADGHRTVFH